MEDILNSPQITQIKYTQISAEDCAMIYTISERISEISGNISAIILN